MGWFRRPRVESWQPEARGQKPKSPKKTRSNVPVESMTDTELGKLDKKLGVEPRRGVYYKPFTGDTPGIDEKNLTPEQKRIMEVALRRTPPILFDKKD